MIFVCAVFCVVGKHKTQQESCEPLLMQKAEVVWTMHTVGYKTHVTEES